MAGPAGATDCEDCKGAATAFERASNGAPGLAGSPPATTTRAPSTPAGSPGAMLHSLLADFDRERALRALRSRKRVVTLQPAEEQRAAVNVGTNGALTKAGPASLRLELGELLPELVSRPALTRAWSTLTRQRSCAQPRCETRNLA